MIHAMRRRIGRYRDRAATETAVRLGLFRRLTPISHSFGIPRGDPVDRHYIEGFLAAHRRDIAGRVLEAGGYVCYAKKFGTGVTELDILYPKPGFADGTLIGNLATGEGIASEAYDCLLLTQVYPYIYDVQAAVTNSRRALKPGGVLIATMAGISQISPADQREWGAYWRFTDDSAARLFGDAFGPANVEVATFGNVLAACALLQGVARQDLSRAELDHHDPNYQVCVTIRAVKREPGEGAARPA